MRILKSYFVFGLCLVVLGVSSPAQSGTQSSGCLNIEQIIQLLERKVDEKSIIENATKYKVDLILDTWNTVKLVRAGASDELIKIIEQNPCPKIELKIIFPTEETQCGATVNVQGLSAKISGKHLWIFAHVQFLKDQWWPQSGEINVNEDGTWFSRAYLGNANDIGNNFEIIAMWVDPATNSMLTNFIKTCSQTGNYPPIQLPKGDPSTRVIVKKTSH